MSDILIKLFKQRFGMAPTELSPVGAHASLRKMIRLRAGPHSAIGVLYSVVEENRAFIEFGRHFRSCGLPVPEVYGADSEGQAYLQEDLGDTTLYDEYVRLARGKNEFPKELEEHFKSALSYLARFQIEAGRSADFSYCYPSRAYDRAAMMWDMHYFRDCFLLRVKIPFDEALLEDDFRKFADILSSADMSFFVYRDFQSRNIMVRDGKLYFIDYQNGRKGALYYDLATILNQSKAPIPPALRRGLLDHYITEASKYTAIDKREFEQFLGAYSIVQLLHRFGAYGKLGLEYGKSYFIESIQPAIDNLRDLLVGGSFQLSLPTLRAVFEKIISQRATILDGRIPPHSSPKLLRITVHSFSYKKGVPQSSNAHGGGFVFDCRCVLNPGREAEYKQKSGLDSEVAEFLQRLDGGKRFLKSVVALVDQAVDSYLTRGFDELSISFGCTGGQHRSVYFAEALARHLRERQGVNVTVIHRDVEGALDSSRKKT